MSASSDHTCRVRALAEFQAKATGMRPTLTTQSSAFATGAAYGAIVSKLSGCCEPPLPPPTNYAAYFTVEEGTRAGSSVFGIPANSEFTIEWWQTDASTNQFQSRNIFSFGTFVFDPLGDGPEFACILASGSVILRIAGVNYPLYDPASGTQPDIYYGPWPTMVDVSNHFAIMRVKDTEDNDKYKIRVFKNGAFLGEFLFPDAISITNTGNTTMTIRNQTIACSQAQMYGSLPSFRWTAARLYPLTTNYDPASNFSPPSIPLEPQTGNVLTINTFPTSGSIITDEGFTVTRYTPDNLPLCQ
jgi:hypothetical protein